MRSAARPGSTWSRGRMVSPKAGDKCDRVMSRAWEEKHRVKDPKRCGHRRGAHRDKGCIFCPCKEFINPPERTKR